MIKAVIFDFDGVIVESIDIKTMAFARLFESKGSAIVNKIVAYHLENGGVSRFEKFKHVYDKILRKTLSEADFKNLCNRFSRLVMDEVIAAPYIKGAKEFLDRYSTVYKCFIVSATPQNEIEKIIETRQMRHYFIEIYGAPRNKTEIVKTIILDNGFAPRESAYVGDAISDHDAALENGLFFIARMSKNEDIFKMSTCPKIYDLTGLRSILKGM